MNYKSILEHKLDNILNMYGTYGYRYYNLGRFESYDFYNKNKDFLESENLLTFVNRKGKLMALKPDVTLSIMKDAINNIGSQQKYFYDEAVYRPYGQLQEFSEIRQIGLEYIGRITTYEIMEVLKLAADSLKKLNEEYILDIASVAICEAIVRDAFSSVELEKEYLSYLNIKSVHGIRKMCDINGICEEKQDRLLKLCSLSGNIITVLERIDELNINEKSDRAIKDLKELCIILQKLGIADRINIDFSIIGNIKYYNGIMFKGYIKNVAKSILSGGQYDGLAERVTGHKNVSAIGFAIYANELSNAYDSVKKETEIIKIDSDMDIAEILKKAEKLSEQNVSFNIQRDIK